MSHRVGESDAVLSYQYALPYREVPITGKPGNKYFSNTERPQSARIQSNRKNASSILIC